MKILHLSRFSGNLGDFVRIRKIYDYLRSRGHVVETLNIPSERYPRRRLFVRPDLVKMIFVGKMSSMKTQVLKNRVRVKLAVEVLAEQLRSCKPDLILFEGFFSAYLATRVRKDEIPIITDVHSVASAELEGWADQEVVEQFGDFEREALCSSSEVIVISNLMKAYLAETYSIRDRKLHVIPNGSDPRRHTAVYSEPIKAIYAGAFNFWENIDSYLDLARLGGNYLYYLAGDGPLKAHILKRIHGEPGRVNYLGYLGYEESIATLTKMTVGIAPAVRSKNIEMAYPVKVFDYLSCGLPVITPNYGEWSRVIAEHKCGFVTEDSTAQRFFECLHQLDKSLWLEMSANGIRVIRDRFNWQLILSELDEVIP